MAALQPGSRVGRYTVLDTLGAGGMGEVFRARDEALDRDVALKVIQLGPEQNAHGSLRFAREARTLAALNHANIAQVYGVEDTPAGPAIAMEFVEGRTLAEIARAGSIGHAAVLDLAAQIAHALDAAHEKGIIHRDLKPANIMVTPDGVAKVLDFGLAKTWVDNDSGSEASHDATAATLQGGLLGTPAYMSPEQARGQAVDRRTDIWAFGCVLFEILAGKPAFGGATSSDSIAAVLEREPDWQALPQDTPPVLRRLIGRCLEKDRRRRLRDIGDALDDLRPSTEPPPADAASGAASPSFSRARQTLTIGLAAATLLLGGTTTWLVLFPPGGGLPAVAPTIRFSLPPPPDASFGSRLPRLEATLLSMAPDGSAVAFVGVRGGGPSQLWIRSLDDDEARPVAGTEGALSAFWSPDGRSIGFFVSGQLRRVDAAGGPSVKICDVPQNAGLSGTWGTDDEILFAAVRGSAILRVAAAGGTPTVAVAAEPGERVLWPKFLPDGRRFFYTSLNDALGGSIVLRADDGSEETLIEAPSRAEWIEPDWLLFVREGTLVAQRVELETARTIGEPVAVLPSVGYSLITAWASFSASLNGTIVAQTALDESRIVWFDRDGNEIGTHGSPGSFFTLRLSPDGSSLLFARMVPALGTYDIWTADLARGNEMRVTDSPGMETGETWVPGSGSIVFAAAQGGVPNLFIRDIRSGEEVRLYNSTHFQVPDDVSPDGTWVAFRERTESGDWDTFVAPLADPDRREPLFATTAAELTTQFAPDGRRLAFVSTESARPNVYLSPFPADGSKAAVSSAGGSMPRWRADGRELFFVSAARELMAVPIDATGTAGEPQRLFSQLNWMSYDVTADGQRFVAVVPFVNERDQPLTVIVGWPRSLPHRPVP